MFLLLLLRVKVELYIQLTFTSSDSFLCTFVNEQVKFTVLFPDTHK
ncbi:MPPV-175 Ig-like domain protein [Magpiepox virus 2]|nr:Ig-like domain protein [Magpiepox virus]QZW33483.1 MPPV-175 Ig-like domain protein [Magpiepox virus 2]